MVTKLNHISQLLSPLFAKMVEPTPLTLHRGYGYYLRQISLFLFHILLSPSPPSMANSEPTTVNTTDSHKTKKRKRKRKKNLNKKKIQPSTTPTKRKISNHQYHHQSHKPTSIIAQASSHNYKHRKPKHTNIKSSDR